LSCVAIPSETVHHTNTISENKQLLQNGNETQKLELTTLSSDNSSAYDVYKLDENKYKNVKGMIKIEQHSVMNDHCLTLGE
jgi:hypothetical protein